MKKSIFFAFLLLLAGYIHSMEVEQPSDIIFLVNKTTKERFSFSRDLFPLYDFKGFKNEIHMQLAAPFVDALRKLLYTHQGMQCVGRSMSQKCLKDIKHFFRKLPIADSRDFVSWFELAYFCDVCNLPSIMKDELLCHITHLIKGNEQQAAQATAHIEDVNMQLTLAELWKTVASFYYLLFDEELEIEGVSHEYGYSLQQIFVLEKIAQFFSEVTLGDILLYDFNFKNSHINSLEGFDLLFTWLPKDERAVAPYVLWFDDNDISFIPDDLSFDRSLLFFLSLERNNLRFIPKNFLSDVPFLTKVSFLENKLTELPEKFLENAPFLKQFDCRKNKLQILPANFLSSSVTIRDVFFDENELTELPEKFLENASMLEMFGCSNNKLRILPANFLSNTPHLKIASFSENELTELPENFLSNAPMLEKFSCRNNKLQVLPDKFLSNSPNLKEVRIDDNQLKVLPPSFLHGCDTLQKLGIKNSDGSYPENDLLPSAKQALEKTEELYKRTKAEKRERETEELEQDREKRAKK